MKKTLKERLISKMLAFAKKHHACKYPVIAGVTGVLCVDYVIRYLYNNTKKLACAFAVLILFGFCSSFAYPVQEQAKTQGLENEEPFLTETSGTFATYEEQEQIDLPEIDDNDVLNEFDDLEFAADEDIDRYSADDILAQNFEIGEIDSAIDGTENSTDIDLSQFDSSDWQLILINKQHSVPDDYEFELGTVMGSIQCDERIFDYLLSMLQAAKEDGVNLMVCSSYRDMNRQQVLFERKIALYMNRGLSYADAYRITSQSVTVPGASEHQIGLAFDIVTSSHQSLNADFGNTNAGKWLAKHSCEFGFILRYPLGKEDITGISYEPWHFRYVGVDAATYITEEEITLEEFCERISE